MNDEIDLTPTADTEAASQPVEQLPVDPIAEPTAGADPAPAAEAEATSATEIHPEQPEAESALGAMVAQDDAPAPVAAPHPADSLLQRLENEVDGLLHSPLALANWVKEMAREARKLL